MWASAFSGAWTLTKEEAFTVIAKEVSGSSSEEEEEESEEAELSEDTGASELSEDVGASEVDEETELSEEVWDSEETGVSTEEGLEDSGAEEVSEEVTEGSLRDEELSALSGLHEASVNPESINNEKMIFLFLFILHQSFPCHSAGV